jgi:hypothetical protein
MTKRRPSRNLEKEEVMGKRKVMVLANSRVWVMQKEPQHSLF